MELFLVGSLSRRKKDLLCGGSFPLEYHPLRYKSGPHLDTFPERPGEVTL